jgi:proteasome lid subunit RPN8/RPN11
MDIEIERDLLEEMLRFAMEKHPREAILLLRGKTKKDVTAITEYLFPPYATTGSVFATYPLYMLPIDFSIIGTAHSHPSGTLQLSPQDMNNAYGRISLLMAYPYRITDVAAFNKQAERIELRVTG